MQGAEVKGMKEFDAVLESIFAQLPEARKELNGKIAEIVKKETAINRVEAMAIREAQKFADKTADKLEEAG